MTELSIADLAKAIHEPTSSVHQQVRDKGKVSGISVSKVNDNGIIKVRVSDRDASRLNLGDPKPDEPARERESVERSKPVEQSSPKPVEQSAPKPVEQSTPEPVEQSTPEPDPGYADMPEPVQTKQPAIYEQRPAPKPKPKPKPNQTRENPSSGGDVFFFGLCAIAALSFEPVRREARSYFTNHDDWTRRF